MSWLVDVSQHFENLPALADKAATAGRGFWSSMSFNENAALDSIRELGNGLNTLAATDLPGAQKAFKEFVTESGLNESQALTLMNEEMVGFKSTLLDAAQAAGLATDDTSLLKYAMGELAPATKEGADSASEGADALDGLQDSAAATQEAISALADEIAGFGSATFDMREANRAMEESYDTLAEKLAASGLNFDVTTEAGRQNEQALDSVAEATNRAAAAILENGGSQDAMNAKLAEGRNALIDILAPYYGSRDAAAAYVDQLNLISPQKVTEVIAQTETASAKIRSYKQQLDDIPKVLTTEAYAQAKMDVFVRRQSDGNANGGIYAYANGGIEAYANGGFPSGIYKGGTPIHKFAEPETLWEAYISGKPSERDRNRQIWVESGERLGIMKEVRAALSAAAGGGRGVSIGSVQFTQPSQRSQLRDLEDTVHRIERGL